jgi:uncharacterized protein
MSADRCLRDARPVAPAWHSIVLIAAIFAVSATGALHPPGSRGAVHRLETYGVTAALELLMLGWVLFGLRLKRTSLRSLLGENPVSLSSIALDLGMAVVFWIASLMVLGTLAIAWSGIEAAIAHRPLLPVNGQPTEAQRQTVHMLAQLAPSNNEEIAAWILLCIIAGFAEEAVFRGYLQRQFTAWGRGSIAAGVVFSALIFGLAHGYEGARGMFLITVFGVLFSLLAIFRSSLRPGIIAHSLQDLFTGLALAILKSQHII